MIERNLALTQQDQGVILRNLAWNPQLSHQEPTLTPVTKQGGYKGPQKSVTNYGAGHTPFK